MLQFATEFPLDHLEGRSQLLAHIWTWLKGMSSSTVLDDYKNAEIDSSNALLRTAHGEELRFREISDGSDSTALGFRHDIPDDAGRLWRTEGVVSRLRGGDRQHLLRLRTQCLARDPGAPLEVPRKPYLIKALLKDGLGGIDGAIEVTDKPLWLNGKVDDLELAKSAVQGQASVHLPIVYISSLAKDEWILSENAIKKMSFDLGGIAHVLVEPDRSFSFNLRDSVDGQNAYNGAIGIYVPGRGMVARYLLGWSLQNASAIFAKVLYAATYWRCHMPSQGVEWAGLQESALRQQREALRGGARDFDAMEELYKEEISSLQEQIDQLKQDLAVATDFSSVKDNDGGEGIGSFAAVLGPEVYDGEIADRLRYAAVVALRFADTTGIDLRSRMMFSRLVDTISYSQGYDELRKGIERACRDGKRLVDEVPALLERHGYRLKSENNHVRLEPLYYGLASLTVSKTPGDYRTGANTIKQIRSALGLKLEC